MAEPKQSKQIEDNLKAETKKWLEKAESAVKAIEPADKKGQEILMNIKAYLSDSRHFLAKGDLIKAFEAVTYAWGIYETCLNLGILKHAKISKNE